MPCWARRVDEKSQERERNWRKGARITAVNEAFVPPIGVLWLAYLAIRNHEIVTQRYIG